MTRRTLLQRLATLPLALFGGRAAQSYAAAAGTKTDIAALQSGWKSLLAANADVPQTKEPLALSNDEWKKKLSPAAYSVLREEGGGEARKAAGVKGIASTVPNFTVKIEDLMKIYRWIEVFQKPQISFVYELAVGVLAPVNFLLQNFGR